MIERDDLPESVVEDVREEARRSIETAEAAATEYIRGDEMEDEGR